MSPNVATAAMSFAAPQTHQLSHFLHIPAAPLFAAYKLYEFEILEPRALPIHFALHNMYGRRRIGRHRFYRIDPSKIAEAIGSENYPRNRTAIHRLFALGFWNETDAGIRPAQSLDALRIDSRQLDAIETWIHENKLGRHTVKIPRYLLTAMPRFTHSQIAVALELIRRATWEGDASETTATMWLRISEIAERWNIPPRTIQYVLHDAGLGEHVRFEVLPTHWSQRQRFGNKYRIVIAPPSVAFEPASEDEKPIRITTSIPPLVNKCAAEDFAPPFAPPPSDFAPPFAPPDLQVCNPLRVYKNQFCKKAQPQDAKPGTGFYQFQNPGEGISDLDLSVEIALDSPIAPVQIQDGYDGGDTADDATADAVPSADTEALENLDLTATPAVVVDLSSVAPEAVSASILPPAIQAPALVTDGPTAAVSAPCADEASALVEPVDALPAVVNAPCPDTNTAPSTGKTTTRPPAIPAALVVDALPPPDFKHIIPEDLHDMARLDPLREQAIDAGYIGRSEADRLRFAAAAIRAREEASNPPAMFRTLVAKGLWTHATGKQEDKANAMIKRHDWGAPPALRVVPKSVPSTTLSADARTVAIARKWQRAERPRDDPLQAFKKHFDEGKDWTRSRWDAACQELDSRGGQTRGREI